MILLITPAKFAEECAAALEKATGEHTQVAASLARAASMMRNWEFTALVIDQSLVEADPAALDPVLDLAGTAIPVFVNFAISRTERVVSDVRAALLRRERERAIAMKAAESVLRSELNGAVTGILLSSELALSMPSLPSAVEAKLRSVYELASQMRSRLKAAS